MSSPFQLAAIVAVSFSLTLLAPMESEAQGRGRGNGRAAAASSGPTVSATVSISLQDRESIRVYYASHGQPGAQALPPGIRRNLERGKPLPPGIAKKVSPANLTSRITVPERFEIVEVGLDVLLVEAATGIIHDVLMDVIR
jgi:hypothetical protein